MKKSIIITVVIFTCLIGYYIIYNEEYVVENSTTDIESYLNERSQKYGGPSIIVERIVKVENSSSWIAELVMSDNTHGYAELIKGWNNRYKFASMGNVPDLYNVQIHTNKGLFVMIIGRNEDLLIKKIKLAINGVQDEKFEFDTSKEQKIIKFIKVPKEFEGMIFTNVEKYDENNNKL